MIQLFNDSVFCECMKRRYKWRELARRTWSISLGQRPMIAARTNQRKAVSLEAPSFDALQFFGFATFIFDEGLRPFRAFLSCVSRSIGRCPMLMIQGLRPYLPVNDSSFI